MLCKICYSDRYEDDSKTESRYGLDMASSFLDSDVAKYGTELDRHKGLHRFRNLIAFLSKKLRQNL